MNDLFSILLLNLGNRHWPYGFGKNLQIFYSKSQFPSLGMHHRSLQSQEIANVTHSKNIERILSHLVFADVYLQPLMLGLDVCKHRFPLATECHQPSGDRNLFLAFNQDLTDFHKLWKGVTVLKRIRKGIDPFSPKYFEFGNPDLTLIKMIVHNSICLK